MFTLTSTYEREVNLRVQYELRCENLLNKWNTLVDRINAQGGEALFNKEPTATQFSSKEIDQLISLCHPDKHDGREIATALTAKLIKLKK